MEGEQSYKKGLNGGLREVVRKKGLKGGEVVRKKGLKGG